MSSTLSNGVTILAADTRRTIQEQDAIKELTLNVGYSYLIESHPQVLQMLREHLRAFAELACVYSHDGLCERSRKVLEIADGLDDLMDVA